MENHNGGNRSNMSFEEESAFLELYQQQVQQGQIIDVSAIKAA